MHKSNTYLLPLVARLTTTFCVLPTRCQKTEVCTCAQLRTLLAEHRQRLFSK